MPSVDFYKDVKRKDGFFLTVPISGDLAQDDDQYGVFFIATRPTEVLEVQEVHSVAGTNGSPVTLDVEKLTGTTAPGAGDTILGSTFDLKSTANTVVTKEGPTELSSDRQLAPGDRLALVVSGTLTALKGVCVTLYCKNPTQGDYL